MKTFARALLGLLASVVGVGVTGLFAAMLLGLLVMWRVASSGINNPGEDLGFGFVLLGAGFVMLLVFVPIWMWFTGVLLERFSRVSLLRRGNGA